MWATAGGQCEAPGFALLCLPPFTALPTWGRILCRYVATCSVNLLKCVHHPMSCDQPLLCDGRRTLCASQPCFFLLVCPCHLCLAPSKAMATTDESLSLPYHRLASHSPCIPLTHLSPAYSFLSSYLTGVLPLKPIFSIILPCIYF